MACVGQASIQAVQLPQRSFVNGSSISKSKSPDAEVYNDYFYGFTYFIGDKSSLSFDEIENFEIFKFQYSLTKK